MKKLAIGIMATAINKKYQDQIEACIRTWIKDCENFGVAYYFLGGYLPYDVPNYINLPGVQEDYYSATWKQYHGLRYMLQNCDSEFYMIIGTDTFLYIERLLDLLSHYNSTEHQFIGGYARDAEVRGIKVVWPSGGSGFILSKKTTMLVEGMVDHILEEWEKIAVPDHKPACDISISYYLHLKGIYLSAVSGFYPADYRGLVPGGQYQIPTDYVNAVSLHFMQPIDMKKYYNFIHNIDWTVIVHFPISIDLERCQILTLAENLLIFCTPLNYNKIWDKRFELGLLGKTFFLVRDLDLSPEFIFKTNPFLSNHFLYLKNDLPVDNIQRLKNSEARVFLDAEENPLASVFTIKDQKPKKYITIPEKIILGEEDPDTILAYMTKCRQRENLETSLAYGEKIWPKRFSLRSYLTFMEEYFIATWYKGDQKKCIQLVEEIDSKLKSGEVTDLGSAQLLNFDCINYLLPRKRICIETSSYSESLFIEYLQKYPDAQLIFKTENATLDHVMIVNNPVIRDKRYGTNFNIHLTIKL